MKRHEETCIICKKLMVQGTNASWCPDSYTNNTTHRFVIEHDENDELIGSRLQTGVCINYFRDNK